MPAIDLEALAAEAQAEGQQQGYAVGFEQGLAEGQQQGLQQGQQAFMEAADRLGGLIANASQEVDQFIAGLERQLLDLALAVAGRVVEREVRTDPELVLGVLRAALAEVADATSICVRVNPADFELVEQQLEGMLRRVVARNSQVTADAQVGQGGCLIETQLGLVDATLPTKLAQIERTLEGIQEGEPL
jgi:flagellar assembly protein FliH